MNRFRLPSSFTAGRKLTLTGTTYQPGAAVPVAKVKHLRNLGALISSRRLVPNVPQGSHRLASRNRSARPENYGAKVRAKWDTGLAPANTFAVSPATGTAAGGTAVTLTGEEFAEATGVTFGGTPGTAFSKTGDTVIHVTTPAHAAGAVAVVVQHPNGNASKSNGFTYT